MRWMIYLTLLAPLLITFLYVDELTYSLLKDMGVSYDLWQLVRLVPVVGYGGLRWALFRDEV